MNNPTKNAKVLLRPFRGVEDLPTLVALDTRLKLADDDDGHSKFESLDSAQEWLRTAVSEEYNPYRNLVFAEIDGQVIGKGNAKWSISENGERHYELGDAGVLPQWRRKGIGRLLLKWQESRLREIFLSHEQTRSSSWLVANKRDSAGVQPLYAEAGYAKQSHRHIMTVDLRETIPNIPIPPGFEVRPTEPAEMEHVWNIAQSGFDKPLSYDAYLPMAASANALVDSRYWHVAWSSVTDEVAGGVFSIVFPRGVASDCVRCEAWSDFVVVLEKFRRQGLGKALLAYHLRAARSLGLTEASLAVDDGNPNEAKRLYDELGYKTIASWLTYRKPFSV